MQYLGKSAENSTLIQFAVVMEDEFEGIVGGEERGTIFAAGEEKGGQNSSGAGAGSDVEEIGNVGGGVTGLTPQNGLEMEQSVGGEDSVGGAAGVDAQDSNFSRGAGQMLVEGHTFWEVVSEEELVLENGEDFIGEFVRKWRLH